MSAPTFTCCVLLLALGAAELHADGLPRGNTGGSVDLTSHPSIHQQELTQWREQEAAGWQPWRDRQDLQVAPLGRTARAPEREVHGYHPYWMGSSYLNYQWNLLSTVAFFSLEIDDHGNITDDHGWPWTGLVNAAHAEQVRVIVTATLFSSSDLATLLASPANRDNAIINLVAAVIAGGADGVNIDFEGVPGSQKQNLVDFLGDLRLALMGALADPYLSIATPAVDWSNAFDYDALAANCDHLMIMGYDYHWSSGPTTGPVAPLEGWGTYNVSWTVNDYLYWGTPPAKMLLGVPYYGHCWPAVSDLPGASTTGTATALTYAGAWSEAQTYGRLWDSESLTPWYRYFLTEWHQTWYEDDESLAFKYDLVELEDLAGVGIWALGYDGSRPELWDTLAEAFGSLSAIGESAADGSTPASPASITRLAVAPNPFNPRTEISFELSRPRTVELSIHTLSGQRVYTLFAGAAPAGQSRYAWDGRDQRGSGMASGLYLVRLRAGGDILTEKVLLMK